VALPYVVTSLVVMLNSIGNATGVVWLPSFPSWYYAASRVLYWPFQPYFALLQPLQANPAVSYMAYAFVSRAPFVLGGLAILTLTGARYGVYRHLASRRAAVVGLMILALLLYGLLRPVREVVNAGIEALDPRDVSRLRDYLLRFGLWAPAVSFLLMVLQSVAAPLPAFVITLANGLLFGAFWGAVLSWSSAMVGAALCFGIARVLGRPLVERLVGQRPLARADAFFERYGSHAVLIARLIPLISFDVVSYAAGLTRISLGRFLLATGIGQLPATIAYSVLGENLTTGSQLGLWAIGVIASLLVLGLAVKHRVERSLPARSAVPRPAPSSQ
jgi:uncharacterized membrane protein YdjX (TVP38/TMEM64 family)